MEDGCLRRLNLETAICVVKDKHSHFKMFLSLVKFVLHETITLLLEITVRITYMIHKPYS